MQKMSKIHTNYSAVLARLAKTNSPNPVFSHHWNLKLVFPSHSDRNVSYITHCLKKKTTTTTTTRKKVRSCKIVDTRNYPAFVSLIYSFIARFKFTSLINLISKMF